jgi:hypothetical protein
MPDFTLRATFSLPLGNSKNGDFRSFELAMTYGMDGHRDHEPALCFLHVVADGGLASAAK